MVKSESVLGRESMGCQSSPAAAWLPQFFKSAAKVSRQPPNMQFLWIGIASLLCRDWNFFLLETRRRKRCKLRGTRSTGKTKVPVQAPGSRTRVTRHRKLRGNIRSRRRWRRALDHRPRWQSIRRQAKDTPCSETALGLSPSSLLPPPSASCWSPSSGRLSGLRKLQLELRVAAGWPARSDSCNPPSRLPRHRSPWHW